MKWGCFFSMYLHRKKYKKLKYKNLCWKYTINGGTQDWLFFWQFFNFVVYQQYPIFFVGLLLWAKAKNKSNFQITIYGVLSFSEVFCHVSWLSFSFYPIWFLGSHTFHQVENQRYEHLFVLYFQRNGILSFFTRSKLVDVYLFPKVAFFLALASHQTLISIRQYIASWCNCADKQLFQSVFVFAILQLKLTCFQMCCLGSLNLFINRCRVWKWLTTFFIRLRKFFVFWQWLILNIFTYLWGPARRFWL